MARAMDVANYVINFCNNVIKCGSFGNKYKYFISNLYLQKLLYFLNVIYLLDHKQHSLIQGEHFETWDYGPVLFDVYETYKTYGGAHISHVLPPLDYAKDINGNENRNYKYNRNNIKENDQYFIKNKLEDERNSKGLLHFRPSYLISKSHEESQWQNRSFRGQLYDNNASFTFYKNRNNQFWINNKNN